jgi:acetylornithine deacetylase/succinyl-diaminopimelate desuccinylase-like protein
MDILPEIRSICAGAAFREETLDLLERLCAVDTSPGPDLARLRENEQRCFDLICAALARLALRGATILQKDVPSAIQNHPAFSRPYYAAGPAEDTYRERSNLLYLLDREPSSAGLNTALNAHIDVVPPFFPPARSGEFITGRGTADDKGNVVAILGALRVLAELERRGIVSLKNKLTAMFVIDEETGGNGSLALALDRALKARYDSLLVLECTGNRLHPANRGAVFIKCEGRSADEQALKQGTPSLVEAYALAILALLDEGEAIRQESDHPLFPHRPVQTCTGILGPFGVHPSAICGEVGFEIIFDRPPSTNTSRMHECDGRSFVYSRCDSWTAADDTTDFVLRRLLDRAIARYIARYGDKTQVIDPATGAAKVARHYDLAWQDADRCTVTICGATGHMGSLPQNDAAIAKWAYVVRELIEARRETGLRFTLAWPGDDARGPSHLVFEGAQGFLPTHTLEEVKTRTRTAFLAASGRYLADEGLPPDALACAVTFDKLHNDAYAGDPNSESMLRALQTAIDTGLAQPDQPVLGWAVSCDARLFAREHPGMPVLTFGAGHLEQAHSDQERVRMAEILASIHFVTLFVLRETGSLP